MRSALIVMRWFLIHFVGQVVLGADRVVDRLVAGQPGNVDAVRHNAVRAFVAEVAQIFAGAVAYYPDLVAGGDVGDDGFNNSPLEVAQLEYALDIQVELCVIRENERNAGYGAELAAKV